MGTNLHKDLADSQVHFPKGFPTASNKTALTKNATGDLEWVTTSGLGSNQLSFTFRGERKAKNSGEYNDWRTSQINNPNTYLDSISYPSTISASEAVNYGRYVVPADCTIQNIVVRAYSASSTMECSLKMYVCRYDCSTAPTTIVESEIGLIMDNVIIGTLGALHCVEKTSFTTSALEKGDIITIV